MKSLNAKSIKGCPFKNKLFTEEVVEYLLKEGFKWQDCNDSYAESRNLDLTGCYKKYEDGGGTDIYIYICEDGIEIDQDYDCGGNLSTNFISFYSSFEETYDKMVECVNSYKN